MRIWARSSFGLSRATLIMERNLQLAKAAHRHDRSVSEHQRRMAESLQCQRDSSSSSSWSFCCWVDSAIEAGGADARDAAELRSTAFRSTLKAVTAERRLRLFAPTCYPPRPLPRGAVAQFGRARESHSRGRRFDPGQLHHFLHGHAIAPADPHGSNRRPRSEASRPASAVHPKADPRQEACARRTAPHYQTRSAPPLRHRHCDSSSRPRMDRTGDREAKLRSPASAVHRRQTPGRRLLAELFAGRTHIPSAPPTLHFFFFFLAF